MENRDTKSRYRFVTTDTETLRKTCIKNDWFNAGTNSQYEKMFEMNENKGKYTIRDIAVAIHLCSENTSCEDIEKVLKELHLKHIATLC